MKKQQRGMTLIGFIFVLIIAGFFALMAMKLVPSYVEYFGVVKSMNSLASEPGSANMSLREIRNQLDFKASFQYAGEAFDANDVHLQRDKGQVSLVVNYQKKIHFIYNISFLLDFKKSVPLSGRSG